MKADPNPRAPSNKGRLSIRDAPSHKAAFLVRYTKIAVCVSIVLAIPVIVLIGVSSLFPVRSTRYSTSLRAGAGAVLCGARAAKLSGGLYPRLSNHLRHAPAKGVETPERGLSSVKLCVHRVTDVFRAVTTVWSGVYQESLQRL
jgi:hypothetical protein